MNLETMTIKSDEAIRFVLNMMDNNLSEKLTYHSMKHTRRVMKAAEELGRMEGVDPDSMELLRLAAAWHDCGYLDGPDCHEERSCDLVHKYFPDFGIESGKVEDVCKLIMATRIPTNPDGLLQKIICDADLNYLGTEEYEKISDLLFLEFKAFGIADSHETWILQQIRFLENHQYYTNTAKNLYETTKSKNLEKLKRTIRN